MDGGYFKWEHTIQTGVPIDLEGIFFVPPSQQFKFFYDNHCIGLFYRFNSSYLILQAMAMWGNDRRMKFVGVSVVRLFYV
jgi:sentrin-specific protease 1